MEETNVQSAAPEAAAPETAVPDSDRKAALYDAFAPALEVLAKKYGIADPADAAALSQALAREAQAREQRRSDQASRLYTAWMGQAEATRRDYPDFDLSRELQDPRFRELLKARMDVRTAYEALHRQELVRHVEQGLLGRLSQGGSRPRENGTAAQGAAVTRPDISRMSRADRQAIIRRVQQGEKISF